MPVTEEQGKMIIERISKDKEGDFRPLPPKDKHSKIWKEMGISAHDYQEWAKDKRKLIEMAENYARFCMENGIDIEKSHWVRLFDENREMVLVDNKYFEKDSFGRTVPDAREKRGGRY